ncbi:MAG TPA: hypothetical protein VLC92_14200 [Rhodocyclaceae bacterium]|nr:hypothetical protein [Rhodocyclaceae bacterium]
MLPQVSWATLDLKLYEQGPNGLTCVVAHHQRRDLAAGEVIQGAEVTG